jgi:glc operon protein GlcG
MTRLIAGAILASGLMGAQTLATKKALTLAAAKQIAAAAEAEAVKNKWNVVISIVDDGGHLIYLQKMDDTQVGSVEIAPRKARTAVFFKRPSKVFEERVAAGGQNVMSLPGVVASEGGLPIIVDEKVIGAIGVSGVTSAQDGQIAKAGLEAVAKLK